MEVSGLRVQHTRSHSDAKFTFSSRVSVITGKNGSGKTTLLEALHIALRGSSFRGTDSEILTRDESWWRIDVALADNEPRIVKFDSAKQSGRKQFEVDTKISYRLPAAKNIQSYYLNRTIYDYLMARLRAVDSSSIRL